MVRLKKYFLSVAMLSIVALTSCVKLSNESFRHLSIDERRSLSAEYTQLAKRLESGSPKNMQLLDKAVRINPQNDLAWRELALPYLYAGMFEEWHKYISKAIELNPEAWQAWRGYDRLFYFRDYAGALFDLDATDTLTRGQVDYPQNISVDYLRGLCYMGMKDYNYAIEYFEKHIVEESEKVGDAYVDEAVFLYMGLIKIEQGLLQEALKQFDRGQKYEDSFADFHFHRARIYCILDEAEKAKEELELAKQKFADENRLRGYRYEAIGQLYRSDYELLEEQIDFSLTTAAS